ncbi:MAG: nicotinamide riboside transporter PnuC [Muribaculaceae bacterium]|nr:nicotinamide riboside transporter PnuC [Muribaculaceae bacterium]
MKRAVEFIKKELSGWGRFERIIFPAGIIFVALISLLMNDSKAALISAICGISYTILAGKGKISCYIFGLSGTLCYSYISWKNGLYGNLSLYLAYYLPMQIFGIFRWSKHLKKDSQEIIKTKLSQKERWIYLVILIFACFFGYFILKELHDANPLIDSITSILSIGGLILTVKRCIEQWHIWFVVNLLSTIMWTEAYLHGSKCFATILMWGIYTILAVYFYYSWKKEFSKSNL